MIDDKDSQLEKGSSTSLDADTASRSLPTEQSRPTAADTSEGGSKAYLSLLGGSLGLFISFGWVNCIALFQAYYERNQLKGYSSSEVSWITSTEFFFMLSMSPLSGYLFDSYGPRLPIFLGGILHVFGLMMASLSSEYYQFMLSQSICSGIGTSLIFTPAMTAPMTYFKKRRALAGGLTVAGSSLGGVIFPLMVNNLLPQVGFGWTMRICAFLILALWIVTLMTITSNMNHVRKDFQISNYLRPFTEPTYLILLVFCFFLYWGLFVPFDYLVVSAIHDGMSATMAFNLIPIMNGASFFGRTIPNALADKFGRFNVLIVMVIFTGIITLGLWYPGHSNAAIIVYAAIFGVSSGACIGLTPPLVMNITKDPREVGFRIGSALAVAGIGTLTSPPIAGAIAGLSGGSFSNAAIFSGVNFLVSAVFLVWLRGRISGWDPRTNA
ncbi:related to monocarboxylate transporter 2 [Ramularia collo-cygni]|uniref:Related to monocarboxylate transporter 2 n=1 Tax=Ramularia collo-cygni TaxID=112498 RepID=A0A2D3V8C4_9PEZI|nr:related to monocarboxylate transporter 2 [Ramularia collo-cygni]CZT21690.1 related to monocarboxylate transporter 2 [Ramularia collo-cygni]